MPEAKQYSRALEALRSTYSPIANYIDAAEKEIAQAQAALYNIWEVLGVDNQTDCMEKLRGTANPPPAEPA